MELETDDQFLHSIEWFIHQVEVVKRGDFRAMKSIPLHSGIITKILQGGTRQ